MITFDFQKIAKETDVVFQNEKDVVEYLEAMRDYFRYHNKNLTSQQYQFIQDFTSIVDAIEKR